MCGGVNEYHTGNAERIRQYLAANPDSRSLAVAAALGIDSQTTWHELKRMAGLGMVAITERPGRGQNTYRVLRQPMPHAARAACKAKAKPKPAQRPIARPAKLTPAKPVPAYTSADYEAAGGVVERLPSHWNATPRGRCGLSYREGSPKGRWV